METSRFRPCTEGFRPCASPLRPCADRFAPARRGFASEVVGSASVHSGAQTSEHDDAREHARRHSSPTHSGNNEASVSDAVLGIVHANLMIAIPTRCDYRKGEPTIYKVPKELKRGDQDEGYEPVAARVGPITGSNYGTMLLEKGNGPEAASARPFTGNNRSTMQLESYKWCCLRRLILSQLESCSQSQPMREPGKKKEELAGWPLDLLLKRMKRLEPKIRESYSENIEHSSDGLAVNMLLDGCFIVHRLLKHARPREGSVSARHDNDDDLTQCFGRVWVWQLVATDLLLLENQIPFFVLREIFELLHSENAPKGALVTGSLHLFRSLCPNMVRPSAEEIDYHDVHHLLHLFYLSVTGPGPTPQPREGDSRHSSRQAADHPDATPLEAPRVDEHHQDKTESEPAAVVVIPKTIDEAGAADVLPLWIPCAKELEEAGVQFRKRENTESGSFLDIKFDGRTGILEIPPLQLYDFSDKLFRNLIAFEQTYPYTWCDITTYAVFMDCLINTPEDMRILHLRGILVNQINGEQDASRFFSSICAQVPYWSDKNYLKQVIKEVNNYREYRKHKWRAALVHNYCSNPWVVISVLAAGFLLIMTILQTIFTGITTFNPPK